MTSISKHKKIAKRSCFLTTLAVSTLFFVAGETFAETQETILPSSTENRSALEQSMSTEKQTFEEKIKSFNEKSARLQLLFFNTCVKVLLNYTDKEERSRWLDKLKLIKTTTVTKEQVELLKNLIPQLSDELKILITNPDFSERTKRLSPEVRKELLELMPSFILIVMQTKSIINQGNSILKSQTDAPSDQTAKFLQIKDTLPGLISIGTLLSVTIPNLLAINKEQ